MLDEIEHERKRIDDAFTFVVPHDLAVGVLRQTLIAAIPIFRSTRFGEYIICQTPALDFRVAVAGSLELVRCRQARAIAAGDGFPYGVRYLSGPFGFFH